MTYQAPLADIGFALKYGASLKAAIEEGLFGDLTLDDVDAVLAEAGRFAGEVIAPLNRVGDTIRHAVQGRRRHHRARLERSLQGVAHRRLERACRAGRMGRPGAAANRQRRLHRNVEFGRRWRLPSARC